MCVLRRALLALVLIPLAVAASAQESPYFVTYDHTMEEPGNLEVSLQHTAGVPRSGQRAYFAPLLEMEYGITPRWTTELYLEGQSTLGDSTIFTGWRLEHRYKLLKREHRFNPVVYLEYENINEGSRIQKEIVGHADTGQEPNADLRREVSRELEGKLILSSAVRGWNVSENFIFEKNLVENEGIEFGYALGVNRPLSKMASGRNCRFCRENFLVGAELYGGLGSSQEFGFAHTAHYAAPTLSWQIGDNSSLKFSPAIGLNHNSAPALIRFSYTYELRGFGPTVASMFRRGKP